MASALRHEASQGAGSLPTCRLVPRDGTHRGASPGLVKRILLGLTPAEHEDRQEENPAKKGKPGTVH